MLRRSKNQGAPHTTGKPTAPRDTQSNNASKLGSYSNYHQMQARRGNRSTTQSHSQNRRLQGQALIKQGRLEEAMHEANSILLLNTTSTS